MVTIPVFRKLAMAFEETEELPHFEKTSFRVNKKIFATLDVKKKIACLMLSEIDQSVFSTYDPSIIYPVPNKWGQKGATYIELAKVRKDLLDDVMQCAYCRVAPKRLTEKYKR